MEIKGKIFLVSVLEELGDSSDPIQEFESWESEAKSQGQLRNQSWLGLQE